MATAFIVGVLALIMLIVIPTFTAMLFMILAWGAGLILAIGGFALAVLNTGDTSAVVIGGMAAIIGAAILAALTLAIDR